SQSDNGWGSHVVYLNSIVLQAEDGIRDRNVTGVQTCALPISGGPHHPRRPPTPRGGGVPGRRELFGARALGGRPVRRVGGGALEIGRASCRGRGEDEADRVGRRSEGDERIAGEVPRQTKRVVV